MFNKTEIYASDESSAGAGLEVTVQIELTEFGHAVLSRNLTLAEACAFRDAFNKFLGQF